MEGVFIEFENENSLRAYPFAAWCVPSDDEALEIPASLFVDAAMYPVNPSGTLYLSSVSADGVFSVSDDTGVIMTGTASGDCVEFRDLTALRRHVGTLVSSSSDALAEFAGRGADREYGRENAEFASSCVFPVVVDGVTSVSVGGTEPLSGNVAFSNPADGEVRVSSCTADDGRKTLRFDVLPKVGTDIQSIRRVICVVDGQTPFRISRHQASYNAVVLQLDGIDRDTVCASAHRESDFEMVDACECERRTTERVDIPETYQIVETFIPPDPHGTGDQDVSEGGIPEGADNAFYIVVPNELGYSNPLSITLEDGDVAAKTGSLEVVVDGYTADLADGEMLDEVTSKGVVIQVPGLSGGTV